MTCTRRHFVSALSLVSAAVPLAATGTAIPKIVEPVESRTLPDGVRAMHERFMQLAIDQATKNPVYPFGAVLVHDPSGEVFGRGVNMSIENPTFHGEIVAINDYVRTRGNRGWTEVSLYTTGEPCAMCTSAIVWAGIPNIVWASSISTIRAAGIHQIDLSVGEVVAQSLSFYRPTALISGVLETRTDRMFASRTGFVRMGTSSLAADATIHF